MRPANVSTSPTEGIRCHAVDPAAKLEELERDSNKSLQVLKKQLEEMAKKQDETIIDLQQKIAQTKEGVLLFNELRGKLKSDSMIDFLNVVTKEQEEKIELLTQQIVQTKEYYARAENMIVRVDSLCDEFQLMVGECKKELTKQRNEMNDQLDGEGAARQVKSPSKEDEDGIM